MHHCIRNSDLAGIKTIAGHVTQERKKSDALRQRRILLAIIAEGDQIQNFLFLLRRARLIRIFVTVGAKIIEPRASPRPA